VAEVEDSAVEDQVDLEAAEVASAVLAVEVLVVEEVAEVGNDLKQHYNPGLHPGFFIFII
jgi:hypothetical protein